MPDTCRFELIRDPHLALILNLAIELIELVMEVHLQHACSIDSIAADPMASQGYTQRYVQQ